MDNLKYIFDLIDKNKDSVLTDEELLEFIKNIDSTVTLEEIQKMIQDNDVNHDNMIDFNEFSNSVGNISQSDISDIYENILTPEGNIDRELFIQYFNTLGISPIYKHTKDEYIDMLLKMMGNTKAEFIEFWNFISNFSCE